MTDHVIAMTVNRTTSDRRVPFAPSAVAPLARLGLRLVLEPGTGAGAWWTDEDYVTAGAELAERAEAVRRAAVVATVTGPDPDVLALMRPGQVLVGLLAAGARPDLLARPDLTRLDLTGLPRRLSAAQTMDALTSQANVAGYRAVLEAAHASGRFLPMLVTAAGTVRPASVLVLGVGVAGLQAIATARRLGAVVTAYDIRPESAQEAASVGAAFLDLPPTAGDGTGGYARVLDEDEGRRQREALQPHVARHDIVIATALVPGRRPPLLVGEEAVKAMRPGSVIVDLAAGADGGNVAGSEPDVTVVTAEGVTVIGTRDLAARMPLAASEAYSRNLTALLRHVVQDGAVRLDPDDEICAGLLVRAKEA